MISSQIFYTQKATTTYKGPPMLSNVLEILEDGEWHNYQDIANQAKISEEKVLRVVDFLNEFSLANVDNKERRVKLSPAFLELPTQSSC
jgi:DNA-binding IclR family transcriptional regulator